MTNIALTAARGKDKAEAMTSNLAHIANELRNMAGDLAGDHNISTAVVSLITDLADAADRMKAAAQSWATECATAAEVALLAAKSVARVYQEDQDAMPADLPYASAAAHHD